MTNEPTHIVECEPPETWNGKTCHPRVSYYHSFEAAQSFVQSRLSLGSEIALKHKHIWSIRKYGSNANDFLYRAAG